MVSEDDERLDEEEHFHFQRVVGSFFCYERAARADSERTRRAAARLPPRLARLLRSLQHGFAQLVPPHPLAAGRVEMGLFADDFPKTCKNFVGLVTGEYEDADGNSQKSAFCYKGMKLDKVLKGNFIAAGNAGLDLVSIKLDQDDLEKYLAFYEDFKLQPKKVGKIEKSWTLRWGGDLGLPDDPRYGKRKEGDQVKGTSREELDLICQIMRDLVKRGEGAEFNFMRSEWSRGCDVTGSTFGAEGFKVAHERGMVSMDRDEDKDIQGSKFFITLKEYPEMDKRWVCFGKITGGMDVLEYIEDEYEGNPRKVVIQDCGVLPFP